MPTLSRRHFVMQSALAATLTTAARPAPLRIVSSPEDKALEAGVAVADLTPPPGLPMWGYSNPDQIAEGTRDPLYGKAVVLRAGGACIALVTLDFGRMPPRAKCDAIRKVVQDAGVGDVIFCASHTHSGPIMELPDLAHVDTMVEALIALVKQAAGAVEPVRLGVGRAPLDIAHNRRVVIDGECWMRWRNLERLPSAPLDPELTAIHLETARGKPLVTLAHYACHPVILGPDNRHYSADWPGAMCRLVEEATGAPCLFLQGAAGDINPYFDKMAQSEGASDAVNAEGAKAAAAVLEALKTIQWPPRAGLAFERTGVEVGLRYDMSDREQVRILRESYSRLYDVYLKDLDQDLVLEQDCLVLNGQVALVFQPGEPFVQFQLDIKARSTLPYTLLCGYANEFHIYFPTVEAAIIGGYGANVTTYVGLGAGERLLAEGQAQIGRLTGRLNPLRGPEDFTSKDWPAPKS